MEQIARNVTMGGWGILCGRRYLLHDRDTKYSAAFRAMIESAHIDTLPLPARSPNLNAHAERWVRSVKAECLSKPNRHNSPAFRVGRGFEKGHRYVICFTQR
jgi:putative transposase